MRLTGLLDSAGRRLLGRSTMVGAGPEAADVRDRLALEAKARLARNALADLEEQLENCAWSA